VCAYGGARNGPAVRPVRGARCSAWTTRSDARHGIKTRHLGAQRQPREGAWLGRCAGADAEATGARARCAARATSQRRAPPAPL
jgi:hypothetical protein